MSGLSVEGVRKLKAWGSRMLAVTGVLLLAACEQSKYFLDTKSCTFYRKPRLKIATIALDEDQCSLIGLEGNGYLEVMLDIRTGNLVPKKNKYDSIRIRLDLKQNDVRRYLASDGDAELSEEPDFPNTPRRAFTYRAGDGELVRVVPYPNSWSARRWCRQRDLRYSYGYQIAPIRYVDKVVVRFLQKIY